MDGKSSPQLKPSTCSRLFTGKAINKLSGLLFLIFPQCRYADSIVGLEKFYSHLTAVQLVTQLLQTYSGGVEYIQQHYPKHFKTLVEQLPDAEMIRPLIKKFQYTECVMIGECAPPLPPEEKGKAEGVDAKKEKTNTDKIKTPPSQKGGSSNSKKEL
jgi:hypothetical protein